MRPLYAAAFLTSILVFASAIATSGEKARVLLRFGVVCERMLDMPFGADIRTIENALGLGETRRQSRQQKNYGGIIFTYVRDDGLVVDVGVKWLEPNRDVPNGKYAYQGHHTILWKGKVWHRWSFADGKELNYFGLADTGSD